MTVLNKHNLAIAALATDEPSRYVLNNVRVTKTETAATDGWRAIIVTRPAGNGEEAEAEPAPLLIPAPFALEVAHTLSKGVARLASVNGNGDHVTLSVEDNQGERIFKAPRAEGNWPDVESVIPKKEDATGEVVLNLLLLIPLLQQIQDFNPDSRSASEVKLRFYGPNKPIRFDAEDRRTGQRLTAAIMVMRDDGKL